MLSSIKVFNNTIWLKYWFNYLYLKLIQWLCKSPNNLWQMSKESKHSLVWPVADRDDTYSYTAFMSTHVSYKGPGVSRGVVHLHRWQVRHSVVTSYGPELAHVGHKSYTTTHHVHWCDKFPPKNRPPSQLSYINKHLFCD